MSVYVCVCVCVIDRVLCLIIKSESGKVLQEKESDVSSVVCKGKHSSLPCSPCHSGKGNLGERWEACLGVCVVSRLSDQINCILHVQQAIRGVRTSIQLHN